MEEEKMHANSSGIREFIINSPQHHALWGANNEFSAYRPKPFLYVKSFRKFNAATLQPVKNFVRIVPLARTRSAW
jgi:hypothetical protein